MKWNTIAAILAFASTPSAFANHEAIRALEDKVPISDGICGFKDKQFVFFSAGTVLAPKSEITRLENCVLFTTGRNLNPAWFLILNENSEPQEVIEWQDPATFRRVWVKGTHI